MENKLNDIKKLVQMAAATAGNISIVGAKGSFKAYVIANLIRSTKRQLLVIAPKQAEAETLYSDIEFFLSSAVSAASSDIDGITTNGLSDTLIFPCLDTLPYDKVVPQIEITTERVQTLSKLLSSDIRCVVTSTKAILRKVIPKDVLANEQELILSGEEIDRDSFLQRLVSWGYTRVAIVEDPGDFAVRGDIIDIYIPSHGVPARIEFFGDLVESIRLFDPLTQRSQAKLTELICFPVVDVIYSEETKRRAISVITDLCDDLDIKFSTRKEFTQKISSEVYFSNLFEFLPAFYEKIDSVFDYLDDDLIVVNLNPPDIESVRQGYYAEIRARYEKQIEQDKSGEKSVCLPPEMIYLQSSELDEILSRYTNIDFRELELSVKPSDTLFEFRVSENSGLRTRLLEHSGSGGARDIFSEHILTDDPKDEIEHKLKSSGGALQPLIELLSDGLERKHKVIITARTAGQVERLSELIEGYDVPFRAYDGEARLPLPEGVVLIMKGGLSSGFISGREGIVLITEEEIFGKRVRRSVKRRVKLDRLLSSLSDLKANDFIVHIEHGIGIYRELKKIPVKGIPRDFLMIEFAGSDILYLPVDRLNLISKYSALDDARPKLDKLGGVLWGKLKEKAQRSIEIMAHELLDIQAKRKLNKGYRFSRGGHYFSEFEASFEYEETKDQLNAINDVIDDMEQEKPMDRLVCGDVGFGKTEVAVRAAFKAVMDGKQAAVLVPTTILAQQHYKTFTDRFKGYPFTIEVLSRFRTPAEQRSIKQGLKDGKINIVIGTHILLSKTIDFLDLGLVVIDEEQRFGVRHKERLKQLKATVDVLTLTATPIPRTLHSAISGIRDISIINTPPLDRLSIRTIVTKFDDEMIKEGITRELRRDGQIFFVHNRVQTIFDMSEHIRKLIPTAKIAVAHGQMHEKELENIMTGFIDKEYDILVSTAIIESGLDISAANTIFINRADAFGLAQLYQLRGRVGRGKVRAYSYLMIPSEDKITKDAIKRLNALMELSELGSGYKIAMYDLEIRGAGNLLGRDQSGNITAIGFDLYTQLLEQALNEMKGIVTEVRIEPDININIPAMIPDAYISEVNQRLVIYQRVSLVKSVGDFDDLHDELIDRYGKFPVEVKNLFELMKLRHLMKKMLIASLDYTGSELILNFDPRTRFDLTKLLALVRREPGKYRFTGEWRFVIDVKHKDKIVAVKELRMMLESC